MWLPSQWTRYRTTNRQLLPMVYVSSGSVTSNLPKRSSQSVEQLQQSDCLDQQGKAHVQERSLSKTGKAIEHCMVYGVRKISMTRTACINSEYDVIATLTERARRPYPRVWFERAWTITVACNFGNTTNAWFNVFPEWSRRTCTLHGIPSSHSATIGGVTSC